MTIDRIILILAGSMVLLSLVLSSFFSPYWLWLAAFVAVMMIQSAFTGFCPAAMVLKKMGVKTGAAFD